MPVRRTSLSLSWIHRKEKEMTHPMFTTKCADCGMPVAEGPLFTAQGELYCETHVTDHEDEELVCDFCKSKDPIWRYESIADRLEAVVEGTMVVLDGAWAACDACCMAVEKHDIGYLIDSAVGDIIAGLPHEKDVRQV